MRAWCSPGLLVAVVLAGATGPAARAEATPRAQPFKPTAADYVVLRVTPRPRSTALVPLVDEYLSAARREREPRFYGRAEALLKSALASPSPDPRHLRQMAQVQQSRHEFAAARQWLDRALAAQPRDVQARLVRAQIAIVQGAYSQARSDCAGVLASGERAAGSVCLAQVLAGQGQIAAADRLLDLAPVDDNTAVQVWALGVRADGANRRGDVGAAERALNAAQALDPRDEVTLLSLVDLLLARGERDRARALLQIDRPSAGVWLRRMQVDAGTPAGSAARAVFDELIAVAQQRGERAHLREEAWAALDQGDDAQRALELARANFAVQRETLDVRLLARACARTGASDARMELQAWLRATGYRDVEVERSLASRAVTRS